MVDTSVTEAGNIGGKTTLKRYGLSHFREAGKKGLAKMQSLGQEFFIEREKRKWAALESKYGPSYMQILAQKMQEARAKKRKQRKLEAKLTP